MNNDKKVTLEDCFSSKLITYSNKNYFNNYEYIDYLEIFETIISSNRDKKASEILRILSKLLDNKYITKEIFNDFIRSEYFLNFLKKHLSSVQIDIINIREYILY
ncbi:hypothetical protein [Aliarcobacter lanthieri]|uniref:hypothetical protein n=1 Tax=Aliarcobacter lanthieri TaxID=1355374 RepID=UPI001A9120B0|nr:hypothetical protein [Aliarcobacter lanthieri]